MRVLMVHARYRRRAGEDRAFDAEVALLSGNGVDVATLIGDNASIPGGGSAAAAAAAIWSRSAYAQVSEAITAHQPDLVHVHNSFPLLSPSVYDAARRAGRPVVQTLHNYRLLCVNALLLRDGSPCELCLTRTVKWPGVWHRCYRDSQPASAAVAAMLAVHGLRRTWSRKVDRFVALSDFARDRFIAGGLPAERIVVKPVPVPDPGAGAASWDRPRRGALYVGRIDAEKGVETLLHAWSGLDYPLTVAGDGPLLGRLRAEAPAQVTFLGSVAPARVSQLMSDAAFLVFPSLCYENFPLAVAEAMAHGLPVVAFAQGAAAQMVEPGMDGCLAAPGDPADLGRAIRSVMAVPGHESGGSARRKYLSLWSPARLLADQLALYDSLLRS